MKVSRAVPHLLVRRLREYAGTRRVEGLHLLTSDELFRLFPPGSEWSIPDNVSSVNFTMAGLFRALAYSARTQAPYTCGLVQEVDDLAHDCGYSAGIDERGRWVFEPIIEEDPEHSDSPPPSTDPPAPRRPSPAPDLDADTIPF